MEVDSTQEQPLANNDSTKKSNLAIIIGISFVVLVIILAVGTGTYYLGTQGYRLTKQTTLPTPLPTQTAIQPTTSSSSEIGPINNAPSTIISPEEKNPNSNYFTSTKLGISFRYAKQVGSGKNSQKVSTFESGNKVYVYTGNTKPETGQYVEVFQKDPSDTFEQAIKKQLLSGIPDNDCFVRISTDKKLPSNFTKATIAFPVPTNSEEPAFTFGEKCPENYRMSNGISYFLFDKNYPGKFLFLSIGQYAIPAESGKETPTWQDTIKIFEAKVCTFEAKLCPDGSSVGRTGPNCEFAPCP